MSDGSVMWTAVPAGLTGPAGAPRLSIVVSPRLHGDDPLVPLSAFPEWVNWPRTLLAAAPAMRVQVAGGAELPVTLAAPEVLEPDLWEALFRPETTVRTHVPEDHSAARIASYAMAQAQTALAGLYGAQGFEHPLAPPAAEQLLRDLHRRHQQLLEAREAVLAFQDLASAAGTALPTRDELAELLDFHQLVGALGDHPALLRALGLVLDVDLPADAPRSQVPQTVRVRPHFSGSDLCPTTVAQLDDRVFRAAAGAAQTQDGLATLATGGWALVSVDVDGAVRKLEGMEHALRDHLASPAPDAPTQGAVPALRTGGISLVVDERAGRLHARLARLAALEQQLAQGGAALLAGDELVRGLCLDVWDEGLGRWCSLFARDGRYAFTRAPQLDRDVEDEGWVQPAVTLLATPGGGAAETLGLHPALARWEGWSLAAPRPGLAMSESSDPAARPTEPANEPLTAAGLSVQWRARPGSLPRLRFGRRYRVRARIVDLAGHVAPVGLEADDEAVPSPAEPFTYRRFEPVAAPLVVLRAPLHADANAGESATRMALRTDNAQPADDDAAAVAGGDRHLAPPRGSVAGAEAHGSLDGPDGRPRRDLYAELAVRDAAHLPGDDTATVGDDLIEVPYLPDPLARGFAFRDLPGAPAGMLGTVGADGTLRYEARAGDVELPGSATVIPLGEDGWPRARGMRVALADGAGAPEWDPAARVLTVRLAKAQLARVPVSSWLAEEDLESMGIWGWIRAFAAGLQETNPDRLLEIAGVLARTTRLAQEGGHWMLTPPRELVLASAVRQPIGRPRVEALVAQRDLGATDCALLGRVAVHAASTARIALEATWTEPIDRADGAPPEDAVPGAGAVGELPLSDLNEPNAALREGPRIVGFLLRDPDRIEMNERGHLRHELHDTRHRVITYTPTAASRFREYFPPGDDGVFTRKGDALTINVPSSARPPAPDVLYAVPAFQWERQEHGRLRASRRRGQALRIYLARPWHVSGAGERLAVVTSAAPLTPELRVLLAQHVSQWGRDPAFDGARVADDLRAQHLADATASGFALALPGAPSDVRVDVAGHDVHYAADRDLWYCDVEVRTARDGRADPAYRPFVHLALARYQPDSVRGAELSGVVMLDWSQLAPDRALTVLQDPGKPGRVRVTVAGHTHAGAAGTSVQVVVQERRPGRPDELGWVTLSGDPAPEEVGAGTGLLWRGTVDTPTAPGRGPFRMLVHEFEAVTSDDDQGTGRRTVYVDALELQP